MRRGVAVWMGCAILMLGVAGTEARSGQELSDEQLRAEMARNRELAAYVKRNGMPDLAETRFLSDKPPWDDHEVRLFYLDEHREIAFARAYLLGRPEVQIERYERALSEEEVASLSSRVHGRRAGDVSARDDDNAERDDANAVRDDGNAAPDDAASAAADRLLRPDERAENAARRAEVAADRVEVAAAAAERAAERTEAVVNKMAAAMTKKAPVKRAAKAAPPAAAAPTAAAPAAAEPTGAAPTASE